MSAADASSGPDDVVHLYEYDDAPGEHPGGCADRMVIRDEYRRIEEALRHARQPVRPQPGWRASVLERIAGASKLRAAERPDEPPQETSTEVLAPAPRRRVLWAVRGASEDAVAAQVVDHIVPGGQIAGRFRLARRLAVGATGSVWSAVNEFTGRDVAIKLFDRSDLRSCMRLLHEARALAALQHRNIVGVYNVDRTSDGKPFVVMELLGGETLVEVLARKRRLDFREVARIGRDVARALAAAHAMSVLHLGMNPRKIFLHHEPDLDGDPLVKVLGFGAPKTLAASDRLYKAFSVLLYTSPEQLGAERSVDQRADIWSLGVVMFEMLTGLRAFDGDTSQILEAVLRGDIPRVDRYVRRIDPMMTEVVARCMSRDPEERYGSAKELATALDRLAKPAKHPPPEWVQ